MVYTFLNYFFSSCFMFGEFLSYFCFVLLFMKLSDGELLEIFRMYTYNHNQYYDPLITNNIH